MQGTTGTMKETRHRNHVQWQGQKDNVNLNCYLSESNKKKRGSGEITCRLTLKRKITRSDNAERTLTHISANISLIQTGKTAISIKTIVWILFIRENHVQ